MRRFVHDILHKHAASLPHAEVEFRVPVPHQWFDSIHACYAHGKASVVSESSLTYADLTDLRCIDGQWQRKRKVAAVRVSGLLPCKLCISVESPAQATKLYVEWVQCTKRRWSYLYGDWRVDFTQSARACNIEIEYTHGIAQLAAHVATGPDNMAQLESIIHGLVPLCAILCLSYARQCPVPSTRGVPFPCFSPERQPVPACARAHYRYLMQQMQPVSLCQALPAGMDPVVSLKHDGTRVVLCVIHHKQSGMPIVCGLTRAPRTHCIPCDKAIQTMVIDCEFMEAERRFIVFDVFEISGQPVKYKPYVWRLNMLQNLSLPRLLGGYTIGIKAFYPAAAVTQTWYDQQDHTRIDGLIIHNKNDVLGNKALMFKWKPQHTVDLVVNSNGQLVDSTHGKPFMRVAPDHGFTLCQGQVWECRLDDTNRFLIILRQRHDKQRANAQHVLSDVKRAHVARYGIKDVNRMLKRQLRERQATAITKKNKRKRCICAV